MSMLAYISKIMNKAVVGLSSSFPIFFGSLLKEALMQKRVIWNRGLFGLWTFLYFDVFFCFFLHQLNFKSLYFLF